MRPCHTYQVLEEFLQSVKTPLYRKAAQLSCEDSQTVLRVYQHWFALLIDLDYLHPETLRRDGVRLWQDFVKADVLSLNNVFADCLMCIYTEDVRGLKSLCGNVSMHLYPLLKGDILQVREHSSIAAARRLIQVFAYMSRLSLQDIDLSQQMIDDYMAVEDRIDPSLTHPVIPSLNKIMREWLTPFCQDPIIPRHSTGGIAEAGRCSVARKYKLLGTDMRLEYCFRDGDYSNVTSTSKSLLRRSKTIFVPKSYKTFRTISMEPATLMFYQQGVLAAIDQMVKRSSYMSSHFGTHDQGRNKQLAQVGSFLRNYATIDLSAASDSVSYNLVKQIFRGTWLYRYLICLRSDTTLLPNKVVLNLKKFAPMGSALCFPVETLIFSAVCEYVTRMNRVYGDYSVYGDDIIVPTHLSNEVITLLQEIGFSVNRSKSFTRSDYWFRESCGGEYICGQDVTPMRISRKFASTDDDKRFTALIQGANSAFTRGFRHLRYCYIADLRRVGSIPLFSPTSVMSDNYTNYHTKSRINADLQVTEFLVSKVVSKIEQKKFYSKRLKRTIRLFEARDESLRLLHWLLSSQLRSSDRKSKEDRARVRQVQEFLSSELCKSTVEVQQVWMQSHALDQG